MIPPGQLKDAGVPVLFRPLHEMNEGWAWRGGRSGASGSAKLFQITHGYLHSRGLTTIIWVSNVKDIDGGAANVALTGHSTSSGPSARDPRTAPSRPFTGFPPLSCCRPRAGRRGRCGWWG
ncbi:glycosyl hydrolase, partial [Streptomyces sp. IBSBF 2435]|uniref:glycosyl hydrolase n=1 Tax=Streptomyces sp. IBSBF 2435 TaxID=2903531 RepID=UPI002FDBAA50